MANDDSILNDVKKLLGLTPEYTAFDIDIRIHINTAFGILQQVGATPEDGFAIVDETTKWSDYIQGKKNLEMVKSYIYLRVRMLFDPPVGSVLTSQEKVLAELEWRLALLEFEFNPIVSEFAPGNLEAVWITSDDAPLPASMEEGDLAIDPISGNVWGKR